MIPEIPEKSMKAEIYLRDVRHMYELSLANMDFSKRFVGRLISLTFCKFRMRTQKMKSILEKSLN